MAQGDVTMKFDANTAAFVQKVTAARAALEATSDSSRKTAESIGKAGEKAEKAFGAGSVAYLQNFATGLLSIGSIVSGLRAGFQSIEEIQERAVSRLQGQIDINRQLSFLAKGEPEKYAQFQEKINALSPEFGKEAAEQLVAGAATRGLDVDVLAEAARNRLPVESMMGFLGNMRETFPGTDQRKALNMLVGAGGGRSEMIAEEMPAVAEAMRQLGSKNLEEPLSAIAGLGSVVTPQRAARLLRTLSQEVAEKRGQIRGYKGEEGLDLLMALPDLAAKHQLRGEHGEHVTLEKFIGAQGQASIQTLIDAREAISAARGRAAGAPDLLAQYQEAAKKDPAQRAALGLRGTKENIRIDQAKTSGVERSMVDEIWESQEAEIYDRFRGILPLYAAAKFGHYVNRYIGHTSAQELIEGAAGGGGGLQGIFSAGEFPVSPEVQAKAANYLEAQRHRENMQAMKDQTEAFRDSTKERYRATPSLVPTGGRYGPASGAAGDT